MRRAASVVAIIVATGTMSSPSDTVAASPGSCEDRSITVGGRERSYILCMPTAAVERMPVLMVFHGGLMNAWVTRSTTPWHQRVAQQGFITIYANACLWDGTCNGGFWNSDSPPSFAGWADRQKIDDKRYVTAVLNHVAGEQPVDWSRIYALGISNGGRFAYSLACDMAATFAGVSVVSGTMTDASCAPTEPVPVLHIHGTADVMVSFSTMSSIGLPPAADGLTFWTSANGCRAEVSTTVDERAVICQQATGCAAGGAVEWCLIKDAGHIWASVIPLPAVEARLDKVVFQSAK